MFNSIAYATEAQEAAPTLMQQYSMPIMLLLFFLIFYFLIMRPQKKKQQEQQKQLKSLKAGDKVMLVSGIFGTIDSTAENNTYYVSISSNVKIHVVQQAIAQKITDTPEKK